MVEWEGGDPQAQSDMEAIERGRARAPLLEALKERDAEIERLKIELLKKLSPDGVPDAGGFSARLYATIHHYATSQHHMDNHERNVRAKAAEEVRARRAWVEKFHTDRADIRCSEVLDWLMETADEIEGNSP